MQVHWSELIALHQEVDRPAWFHSGERPASRSRHVVHLSVQVPDMIDHLRCDPSRDAPRQAAIPAGFAAERDCFASCFAAPWRLPDRTLPKR